MTRMRSLLILSAVPLVACGGDGGIEPEGPRYTYVVSEAALPPSGSSQVAREYGLDLNGDKVADNQLGAALGTLQGMGFPLQPALTEAVDQGDVILLLELQAKSFASASAVGFQVKLGATPMPAPCTSTQDTACRRHLSGQATFTISPSSPNNAAVTGKIAGGTFDGGPGEISLQLGLGGGDGIRLDLIGARARATGMSEAGIDSVIVGGALTEADLTAQVLPAIQAQIAPVLARDCAGATPPTCTCVNPSTGRTILGFFDNSPKDCTVSVAEIQNNPLIKTALAPDVEIDGRQALSVGVKVKAVKGAF
jgi:hypothetical protein